MNYNEASQRFAERMKRNYPSGTRIELIQLNDPYTTIPPGTRGTVQFVDDLGTVHPAWDIRKTKEYDCWIYQVLCYLREPARS